MSEKNEKHERTHVPPVDTSAISAFSALWRQETNRMLDEMMKSSERSFQEAGRVLDEATRFGAAQLSWSREVSRAFLNGMRASL
jgi:hypothetical protein